MEEGANRNVMPTREPDNPPGQTPPSSGSMSLDLDLLDLEAAADVLLPLSFTAHIHSRRKGANLWQRWCGAAEQRWCLQAEIFCSSLRHFSNLLTI